MVDPVSVDRHGPANREDVHCLHGLHRVAAWVEKAEDLTPGSAALDGQYPPGVVDRHAVVVGHVQHQAPTKERLPAHAVAHPSDRDLQILISGESQRGADVVFAGRPHHPVDPSGVEATRVVDRPAALHQRERRIADAPYLRDRVDVRARRDRLGDRRAVPPVLGCRRVLVDLLGGKQPQVQDEGDRWDGESHSHPALQWGRRGAEWRGRIRPARGVVESPGPPRGRSGQAGRPHDGRHGGYEQRGQVGEQDPRRCALVGHRLGQGKNGTEKQQPDNDWAH